MLFQHFEILGNDFATYSLVFKPGNPVLPGIMLTAEVFKKVAVFVTYAKYYSRKMFQLEMVYENFAAIRQSIKNSQNYMKNIISYYTKTDVTF